MSSPPAKPPKPKNVKLIRAEHAYVAEEEDELSFDEGDLLYILDSTSDPSWWRVRIKGKEGMVPSNLVSSGGAQDTGASGNAFHDACKRGNLELLEECLANKIPVNVPDKAGNTGLHWACRGGHGDIISRLLELKKQLEVDLDNRLGDTPLHLAAERGSKIAIELLRETERVNVMKPNAKGKTAYDLVTDADAKAALRSWMKEALNEEIENDYEASSEDEEENSEG